MRVDKRKEKPARAPSTKEERNLARESDSNDLNDTAPYGRAKVQTTRADFERNKDGLYGGLPKARDPAAPGERPTHPTPNPKP